MRRIGILTFHRAINYGAFLQSFSLCDFLQREYPESTVEIVDYLPSLERKKIYRNILRTVKYHGLKNAYYECQKIKVFSQSLHYLHLSPFTILKDDFDRLFHAMEDRYDLIVVGSDAVLNWNQNGFPSAFYLDYDFKVPVVTYAASAHGLEFYELSKNQYEFCRRCFHRFSALTVRDRNTEDFVRFCSNTLQPSHVCDPTFLIDLEKVQKNGGNIEAHLKEKYGFDLHTPYIVVMLLDAGICEKIYQRYHDQYKIITLFKPNAHSDAFLYDLNPFQWVQVLAGASLVITQYFHGALLAMRNGVSTVVIDASGYEGRYESKLYDLMHTRLQLEDHYLTLSSIKQQESRLWDAADPALKADEKDRILTAMNHEAETSRAFLQILKQIKVKTSNTKL